MCSINSLEWSVCPSLTQFYLMVEVYLNLLPKVQLHVSALDNSHLQVVHESLDLIWAVCSGDVGDEVGTRSRTCHGGWGVGTWGSCYYVYLS